MRVVFRCDASIEIGTGHVMRCLTLAEHLRADGASVVFVSREFDGHLCEIIGNKQFKCFRLPQPEPQSSNQFTDEYALWLGVPWREDAEQTAASLRSEQGDVDWLVVDHYGLGKDWEEFLRPQVGAIMVIDDLANRPYDCDILLDQNLYPESETRYNGLVAGACQFLLGPDYAMLRPQFAKVREKMPRRDGSIQRILIFMGGADPSNQTRKAVEAVLGLNDISADVIVGRSNPNASTIMEMCNRSDRIECHQGVDNVAKLMATADLAIGAAGTTTWERCSVGLPTLLISIANNQTELAQFVQEAGFAHCLGLARDVTPEQIAGSIRRLMTSPEVVRSMSHRAMELVDGQGCARVAAQMKQKMRESIA